MLLSLLPQFYLDPKPLLKLIFTKFLGSASGFVDVVAKHVPSPVANAQKKVRRSERAVGRFAFCCTAVSVAVLWVLCVYRNAQWRHPHR